jgi:DNA-binding transcriptional ArsR family regulator
VNICYNHISILEYYNIAILEYKKGVGVIEKRKIEYLTNKADILKAIANPIRLCIINCLMNSNECNVSELQKKLNKPQSTISQHLRVLKQAGIVKGVRDGQEIHYLIIDKEVEMLLKSFLKELIKD